MYIGQIPTPTATESRQEFTATSGQTQFQTTGGTEGYCDCFLNGVKLDSRSDFSFDGTTVTLTTGAAAGDVLAVVLRQADSALVALPIKDSAGNNVLSESSGVVSIDSGVQFPAGHVIQTKILKESNSYGSFGSQGDTYTGISIAFDNNLSSTNSTVLIESSIQYDVANDVGLGFTWATSSSTLSGNKIGVDGSNITNFSKSPTPYVNASRHGDTISFMAYDTNITSTTPKTYYLWLNNTYPTNVYINYHTNLNYAAQLGTGSYWPGSVTSVFKLTEIAG